MRLRKYFINKIFLFCTFPFCLFGEDLNELLDKAIELNPKVVDKKLELLKSNIVLDERLGNYAPKVDFSYRYGYVVNENKSNNDTSFIYKSPQEQLYSISVIQNIFRGFKDMYEIENKKNNLVINEYEKLAVENTILKEVLQLYFELYMFQERIKLLNHYIIKIDNYLLLSQEKRIVVGTQDEYFPILDISNKFKTEKLELEYSLKTKIELLKELTGSQNKILLSNYIFKEIINSSIIEVLKMQEEVNPVLKASELTYKNYKTVLKSSRSNLYPSLDLELSYSKDNQKSINYKESTNKSAYLKLNYNIFNGMKDKNNLEKIKIETLQSKNKFLETKKKLQREIKSELFLFQKIEKEIKLIEEKLLYELEASQFTLNKSKLREVNLSEIVNRLRALYDTNVLYIVKKTQKKTNHLNILYLIGSLKKEVIDKKQLKIKLKEEFLKGTIK